MLTVYAIGAVNQGDPLWIGAPIMALAALLITVPSLWFTHVRGRPGGEAFTYLQIITDILFVTAIVHATGGAGSYFAFLYILVISVAALLLPLSGGVLVGILTSMVYFGDTILVNGDQFSSGVLVQVGLFTLVAVVTGWVGDRLRRTRLALGAVESELRRLRLDTTDILDSIGSGVLTVDREERLHFANRAAERLLSMEASQWLGQPVVDRVAEASPELGRILRRTLRDERPKTRSKAVATLGDAEIMLGVSTTVLKSAERNSVSVTAIFADITNHERLRALRRRAERLEAVAELSASLAHEIKNPLASIRSAVEQLANVPASEDDHQTLRDLVIRESERVSRLLSEFIDFSSMRLGIMDEVDLSTIVDACIQLVQRHPERSKRNVTIDSVGIDEPLILLGDEELLHRAISNLLLNAVQFSPDGGRVRIEVEDLASDLTIGPTGIPRPVRICVHDSGPGVNEDELPRIFDPFYTTRSAGNGLGLSVVQRSIESHEGAVLVERSSLGGAEFQIYLPGMPQEETVATKA